LSPETRVKRTYDDLADLVLNKVTLIRPPERLTVAEAAEKFVYLRNPGSYIGPWKNTTVPYMVEPMECLTDPEYSGVGFCGSAQSGKTASLILNYVAYGVCVDPMDTILYNPSMAAARDFSMRRVDRMHQHSPDIGKHLGKSSDSDNKLDKHYDSGMMFSLSWPSSTEMAGKPIPRVLLTDYDRIAADIDGEGSAFDLASKRTTTFGSFGKTVVESSPSREIENYRWIAKTPHEAPPTTGILEIYNRGDRRRFYYPCPLCNFYFEGSFAHIEWEEGDDILTSAESAHMVCPKCQGKIGPEWKHEMNLWGTWLKDGEYFDSRGRRYGNPVRSTLATFWHKGVSASFVTWQKLVENYLTLNNAYETSGDEGSLQKFYNTDLAEIYIPKGLDSQRTPESLKSRAEDLGDKVVPLGVRFLIATVDVQKNRFVVQVHGIAPGLPFDMCLVDRFIIYKSERIDEDGERLWIKPSTYLEDWDLLIEQVMQKEYPLADNSGRYMAVYLTASDSAGKEGVTTNAYNFYRRLKDNNMHGKFHLLKGDPNKNAVRARITYPDSNSKARNAGARGDVPVLFLNVNSLKDALHGRLDCTEPGKGMYRFPNWMPDWWYMEMCSEKRTPKGWEKLAHQPNEAWDLSNYCIGVCVSTLIKIERFDWNDPPAFARAWDKGNVMIREAEAPKYVAKIEKVDYDFSKFAERLA
jgi:phage terminase large subunit GpA-like protein